MSPLRAPRAVPVLLLLSFVVSCCSPLAHERRAPPLLLMCWNVLSLFDAIDDGYEYEDFSVERGLWGEARYRRRLELVAGTALAAREAGGGGKPGPDILCLVEIEKESILADLAAGPLAAAGYRWRAFAKAPGSPIGLGILSRLPLEDAKAYGLRLGERNERPVLEARFDISGGDLAVLLCHWKSKLEGAESTEPARIAAASQLGAIVGSAIAADPALCVIACGDFNENPDEYARTGGRYPTALRAASGSLPAPGPKGEASGTKTTVGGIRVGGREEALASAPGELTLFSPWTESDSYSYVHRGVRERIDGFLLAPGLLDGKGLDFLSFGVMDGGGLVDAKGTPIPWSNSSLSGQSDHLPILLELSDRGG